MKGIGMRVFNMKKLVAFVLIFVSLCGFVHANLLVSPTRIAFEKNERVKDVILINVSEKTRSYRIEWQENIADENGAYRNLPESEVTFAASKFVRYSPRQVTLKAGERQTIKLMLRRKANMTLPEYRSHLKVTALPPKKNGNNTGNNSSGDAIGFKIDVLTSYTLPVIIKTKVPNASVNIKQVDIKLAGEKAFFKLDFEKVGNSSVIGDINVYFTDDANGIERNVGILRGVSIFHENNARKASVEWQGFERPLTGTIRIEYKGSDEFRGEQFASYESDISLATYK